MGVFAFFLLQRRFCDGRGELMKLYRHTAINLAGMGLPLLAAVVSIPLLIKGLGIDRFGVLALLWALVSYAGLLDLGLGKVITREVVAARESGRAEQTRLVVDNTLLLMVGLSLLVVVLTGVALLLLQSKAQTVVWGMDALAAGAVLLLGVPAVVLSNGYRGLLEADSRFGFVNLIRLPLGLWNFVAPLAVVTWWGPSLVLISWALVLGRVLGMLAYLWGSRQAFSPLTWWRHRDVAVLRSLSISGGWMTVSSLLSAFMGYLDRFLLGLLGSPAAVTHYTVPHEIVTKLWILPTSVVNASFPTLVAAGVGGQGLRAALWKNASIVALLVLPICLFLAIGAEWLLTVWIGGEVAQHSHEVLAVLALGMAAGALAAVPFNALHALGEQRKAALVHCLEFPVFLVLIALFCFSLGGVGGCLGVRTALLGGRGGHVLDVFPCARCREASVDLSL